MSIIVDSTNWQAVVDHEPDKGPLVAVECPRCGTTSKHANLPYHELEEPGCMRCSDCGTRWHYELAK